VTLPLVCIPALMLAAGPEGAGFGGVRTATVESVGGVPRLVLDGRPTPPLIFFHNTDVPGDASDRHLAAQVALARDAGVHLYSLPLRCPRLADGVSPNVAYADSLLDRFITVDPEALFMLRLYVGCDQTSTWWRELAATELERYADGSTGGISITSEEFAARARRDLIELVDHFEASPYAGRVIAYSPGHADTEMFPINYREKGPDLSQAAQRAFRRWLRARYRADAALRRAWGRDDVSLDTAEVPVPPPGRFPMHMGAGGTPLAAFYALPGEQDWVDYSDFISEVTADRILEWARIIKERTGRRRLSCFFYGYTFDLPGSLGGHGNLARVLSSPDVDMVASPYSYADRFAGGTGNFMSPVDSVALHGKLWMNEDDTRTSLLDLGGEPAYLALFTEQCQSLNEDLGVLGRNLANLHVHRAGTWWMDLISRGAFEHPALWKMLRARREDYSRLLDDPAPFRPDVALVADEESKLYVKDDWDANWWLMYHLRDEAAKCGASVGYYLLDDLVSGLVPPCRLYVFVNAFRLDAEEVAAIGARLDVEGATALWVYAPGYVGSGSGGVQAATGIAVAEDTGTLAGEAFGSPFAVSPRLAIRDADAAALATYREGGAPSVALKRVGGHASILCCDWGPPASVLRRFAQRAGAHIYVDDGSVVLCDGRLLAIHTGTAGTKTVHLPAGVTARPLDGHPVSPREADLDAPFEAGETRWFALTPGRDGP